jgi:type 1 glutamine amidotransferase
MKRSLCSRRSVLRGLAAAVAVPAVVTSSGLGQGDRPAASALRVLLTYGGHAFQEKEFFAFWDGLPGITYTKAPLPQAAGLLKPGLEKQYDALVMYDMDQGLTPERQRDFVALLQTGIGVVALHHNLNAHNTWDEYRRIIGGKWLNQPETIDGKSYSKSVFSHGEDIPVRVADTEHPITKGLSDFVIHDETYGNVYVAPDVHVLLTTDHPKSVPALAWVTRYGKSRVVYYMAGHDADAWKNPNFRTILLRSIRWVARSD